MEALPSLCDTMQSDELYTRKDGAFRIRSDRTLKCARLYQGKRCVSFTLADLRYMSTMLHVVQAQRNQYILAQADVELSSLVFAEPQSSSECPIQYDQLCAELKLQLL